VNSFQCVQHRTKRLSHRHHRPRKNREQISISPIGIGIFSFSKLLKVSLICHLPLLEAIAVISLLHSLFLQCRIFLRDDISIPMVETRHELFGKNRWFLKFYATFSILHLSMELSQGFYLNLRFRKNIIEKKTTNFCRFPLLHLAMKSWIINGRCTPSLQHL